MVDWTDELTAELRALWAEGLLQSGRTVIRMAIAEIAHQHPEASTIPRATMLNPEGDEP